MLWPLFSFNRGCIKLNAWQNSPIAFFFGGGVIQSLNFVLECCTNWNKKILHFFGFWHQSCYKFNILQLELTFCQIYSMFKLFHLEIYYCIRHIFRVQIFSQFWTRLGKSRGLYFITINSHIVKCKFLQGLTREVRENNHVYSRWIYIMTIKCHKTL